MTDYSSEDFWKGAPETSTHYQPPRGEGFNPVFWRVENGVPVEAWAVMENGDLRHVPKPSYIDDVFGRLIARPAPPWSGDGLPPVGTVCEVCISGEWVECEVIAHFMQIAAEVAAFTTMRPQGGKSLNSKIAECFRPIKTPAQIAAEEREAAIKSMMDIFPLVASKHEICAALYGAGLRFPKGDDK